MLDLRGKTALVTGGGTGIGRATALLLGGEGVNVVVNYSRSRTDAEATAEELRRMGVKGVAVRADVSDDAAVREMVAQTDRELGGLDILVNNAGATAFVEYTNLEGIREEDWDRIFGVNLKGAFFCCRAAIALMRRGGAGQIVNVSSISGFTGKGSSIPYAASKAALINMTKALAGSQAPVIRVNCVAPGVVRTRWIAEFDESFEKGHQAATPMGRLAEPEDVAVAIHSLLVNSIVTGVVLEVDGGRLLV